MDDTIIEPDEYEETKEYQLTVAISMMDEWMMDICSGDAVEDFPHVPLMQFIIGILKEGVATWRKSFHYDLRVEQIGQEQAFIELMAELTGLKLEEE